MKSIQYITEIILIFTFSVLLPAQSLPELKTSDNHRYLVQMDEKGNGKPFLYIGDTSWELISRLTREEVETYLRVRKKQGFNVIMMDSHNEIGEKGGKVYGVNYPNRYGYKPFKPWKPFTPEGIVEAYWDYVDWIIDKAEEYDFYVAFLTYFGNRYVSKEREPLIQTADQAYHWGYFLGNRYRSRSNIIWLLGGDYEPLDYKTNKFDPDEYEITIATAEGIADGINGTEKQFDKGKANYSSSLMTYHINEGLSSSSYFHHEPFLDFNAIQSGHNYLYVCNNHLMVKEDYEKKPVKPTIDLEPWYEYIMTRIDGTWKKPRCTAYDVRRNAYRSVLAGAFGISYGNNNVWMFYRENMNYEDRYNPTGDWDGAEGIYSKGAEQLIWLKNLFTTRAFHRCIPSSEIITKAFVKDVDEVHIQSAIADDQSFVLMYIPSGQVFNVDLTRITGDVNCWWYNPEDGEIYDQDGMVMKSPQPFRVIGRFEKTRTYQFSTPTNHDWILVLDDKSKDLPPPGKVEDR